MSFFIFSDEFLEIKQEADIFLNKIKEELDDKGIKCDLVENLTPEALQIVADIVFARN